MRRAVNVQLAVLLASVLCSTSSLKTEKQGVGEQEQAEELLDLQLQEIVDDWEEEHPPRGRKGAALLQSGQNVAERREADKKKAAELQASLQLQELVDDWEEITHTHSQEDHAEHATAEEHAPVGRKGAALLQSGKNAKTQEAEKHREAEKSEEDQWALQLQGLVDDWEGRLKEHPPLVHKAAASPVHKAAASPRAALLQSVRNKLQAKVKVKEETLSHVTPAIDHSVVKSHTLIEAATRPQIVAFSQRSGGSLNPGIMELMKSAGFLGKTHKVGSSPADLSLVRTGHSASNPSIIASPVQPVPTSEIKGHSGKEQPSKDAISRLVPPTMMKRGSRFESWESEYPSLRRIYGVLMKGFFSVLLWAVLTALLGIFYHHEKHHPPKLDPAGVIVSLHDRERLDRQRWRFGLFECLEVPSLCLFSFFCAPIRWADTMRMAGFMNFFSALALVVGLTVLGSITLGLGFVATIAVCVHFRHRMRHKYDIRSQLCGSYATDVLSFVFCPWCSIVQEARQIEEAYLARQASVRHEYMVSQAAPLRLAAVKV